MSEDIMAAGPEKDRKENTQNSVREAFKKHVENYDLPLVFNHAEKDTLTKLCEAASDFFGPLASRLEDNSWVEDNWEQGREYGYVYNTEPPNPATAIDCKKVLRELGHRDGLTDEPFKWLFSSANGHWNIGQRGGYGIKSVLEEGEFPGWVNERLPGYRDKLNEAIKAIADFDPSQEEARTFYGRLIKDKHWEDYPDLSVLFHLVWPQFFPLYYKSTIDDYSQVRGMHRLLDITFKYSLSVKKELNIEGNYDGYAAVYRLLLVIYDDFVRSEPGKSLGRPHFDFLTQLLAEKEDAEAVQLLLMKQALVLYGVPGTGKTYLAMKELLPSLCEEQHRIEVQFHAGYSYADFIIGIRPKTNEKGAIIYEVEPGRLYRLAAEAAQALKGKEEEFGDGLPDWVNLQSDGDEEVTKQDKRKPLRYALLIDEINRADVARVFGEVLYCIEYRHEPIPLPHTSVSKKIKSVFSDEDLVDPFEGGRKFYLPKNLYLVGTMNHADRSIGAFDAALRRRFAWYRLDFSSSRLDQMLQKALDNCTRTAFLRRAEVLNDMIASGRSQPDGQERALPLSAEHKIGHTYFAEILRIMQQTGYKGSITSLHLERLWLYFLEPLLEDALGFEAGTYRTDLDNLKKVFIKKLQELE